MKNNLLYLCIGIVLGGFVVKCNPNTFIECEEMDCYNDSTYTEIKYLPGKDSTYVDSFYISNTVEPTRREVEEIDTLTNKYTNSYKDSLVDATVITEVEGIMTSQTLSYTINVPKEITERVDTVLINNKIYHTPKLFHRIYFGGELQGNPMFIQYGLNLSYQNPKNKFIYELGYNFNQVMGDNISVGLKVPLFKWKK